MEPAERRLKEVLEKDDPSELRAILETEEPDYREDVLRLFLTNAVQKRAIACIRAAIALGASPDDILANAIIRITDVLPACFDKNFVLLLQELGWDINNRNNQRPPLLWYVSFYRDLALWCIDEAGAKVTLQPQPPPPRGTMPDEHWKYYKSLLEREVQGNGGLELFKELRQRGAPLADRCLHILVSQACGIKWEQSEDQLRQRMEFIRYLIEVEGINVNSPDCKHIDNKCSGDRGVRLACRGGVLSWCHDTPESALQVVRYLLEQGADPTLKLAQQRNLFSEDWDLKSTWDEVQMYVGHVGHGITPFIREVQQFWEANKDGTCRAWSLPLTPLPGRTNPEASDTIDISSLRV